MLGERLRIAREAAGLRQTDAASHLGIAMSGICEMESGRREPKAAQLAALGRLYRHSLDFFFSEEPVIEDMVLWRGRPDDERTVKHIQREFFSLCEDYQELEDLTGSRSASRLPQETVPRAKFGFPQAESLAARIWQEFELGAVPAESLRLVLEEKYQVKIFALPLATEASAASTRSNRFGPATLLNRDSVHWRRNFDLAHELFHLLTWPVFRSPDQESSVVADEEEERFANCFASHLLLPEGPFSGRLGPFVDQLGNLKMTFSELHNLARSFGVSADAVIYRCAGLLHWRKEKTQAAIDQLLAFRVWRESKPVEMLPPRYVSLAVLAYRLGLISFQKGAEYLRKTYKETESILEPPEDGFEPERQIAVAAD